MASPNESRSSPPPVRSPQSARIALIAGAMMIALAVLLVVLMSGRTEEDGTQGTLRPEDFSELVLDPLDEAEQQQSVTNPEDINVRLTQGAFISGFSEDGQLVQRYTADRITPLPNREIEMTRPLAFLYLDDGRIVSMTGDVARVQRGGRDRLESGRITDNVIIRVFEPRDGAAPDPAVDAPSVVIRTNQAELNDPAGEIRCDGIVRVTSDLALFTGTGLTILYDKVSGIERLTVEESEPIRIFASALRAQESSAPPDDTSSRPNGSPPADPPAEREQSARTENQRTSRAANNPNAQPTAPATPRTPPPAQPARPARPSAEPFYKLTMLDNVTIHRGPEGAQQIVTGDRMEIVFAMNNRDLDSPVSAMPATSPSPHDSIPSSRRRFTRATAPTLTTMLALSVIGLPGQDVDAGSSGAASDDDIIVTFTGRLVMVPTTDRADRLPTRDSVRLTLTGAPVRILDEAQRAEAIGSRIVYTSDDERVRLLGDESFPLRLSSPDLDATAGEFAFALASNTGHFTGAGTMNLRERASAAEFGPQQDPAAPNEPANDGLDIRWSRGVELQFVRNEERNPNNPSDRGGRLRLATFRGDVVVRNVADSERFTMNTDELTVAFAEQGTGEAESVRYIEANGNVVVEGLDGQASTLLGDALRLDFEWNEELAHMSPRTLVVSGNASASDATQSIAAEKLTVTLIEKPEVVAEDGDATDESRRSSNIEIDTLLAEQRVTVRLQEGLTVTGDRLFAVATSEHAEMTGLPVRIVGEEGSTNFVAVGSQATIDRVADGNYRVLMNGGGNLQMSRPASTPSEEDADSGRAAIEPDSTSPRDESGESPEAVGETFVVEWEDSLQYDEFTSKKLARVDVRGRVKAVSRPTPLEDTTVDGEKIVLELDLVDAPATEKEHAGNASSGGAMDRMRKNRELRSFTAHGAPAKLESRTWQNEARTGVPQVHYIEGKQVSFDAKSRDAEVIGQGTLLVQDLTPPAPGEPEPDFGERGTTMFEWQGGMEMKELVDGRYDMSMTRQVTMRHRGMDGRIATLQTPRLEVTAKQRDAAQSPGGLDFGGQVQLLRFVARATEADPLSRVLLEALGNTINASSVDYNYETALMQIRGTSRNPAMFSTEKQITPTRASEILWDLRNGTIRFKDASTNNPR